MITRDTPIPSITLTWFEVRQAAQVGIMRQVQNLMKYREDYNNCPKDMGWQFHIEGACGECALAKHRGVFWSGNLGEMGADDVGKLQVRTAPRHTDSLLLKKKDKPDRVFVLAIGLAPTYRLIGWIRGADGKKDGPGGYWRDPVGDKGGEKRPAYFVPQEVLNPMSELPDE